MSTLKNSDYVHLHNHTQYSLLDGLTKIGQLMDFVGEQSMHAVAMTDHGTMSGSIEFYKEAKARDIKPIIGIEAYVASRKHTDKDSVKDKNRFHLIVLAMNNTGYQNLMRLSTIANLDGYYYYPRIDHDLLETYGEGLIILSACMGGEVGSAIHEGQYDKAKEIAAWYKSVFGDRYYLEIQDHGHPENELFNKNQHAINQQVLKLGAELDIACVVTCDAHYLKHEDQDAHEILLCVGTGSFLSEPKRMSLKDYPLHVTEPQELIKRWGKTHPELILNTRKIADRCSVELELGKILIPKFAVPEGETEESYLRKLVWQGLLWRYKTISPEEAALADEKQARAQLSKEVVERTDFELSVISSMGFNGYFLIVADFINWGKDQGIVFGPGRGSAAGSIVAYATRITELDPLAFNLLFERFLNPDRISMPDIDIDIQDSRRDEVIQYCVEKYGDDRVANIVTFGRMAARAAVRDVARVLEMPYADADRIAKLIPPPVQGRHIPLAKSIVDDPVLRAEYESNPRSKVVIDQAIRLEGTIRSHGVHAAGVVIAPDDIVKFVPLEMAQKGVVTTQYSMGPIEDIGLLKMDFLGLANLTIIKNALRIIKRVYDKDIDILTLPLDDEETYKLLQRGDTTGVFQFESQGMKKYLRELKPTVFEDISAMGALYRPGPLGAGLTDSFIKRKNGQEAIVYVHESMKPALESTYGVLVYQEQVMQIARTVCGFTGGQADTLRKAIGKKIKEVMQKMEKDFIEGGIKHSNVPKGVMEKFWKDLLGFADYCFNKSHSACYGLIAYWTAYLKAHYPSAFMAAVMTSDYDDTDRLAIEISECQTMGITVLAPDINESYHEFAVVADKKNKKSAIRFGLDAVKNVGHGAVEEIIRARESTEHNAFESLEDFFRNVNVRTVNRKNVESLIRAGAFDRFGARGTLLFNVDQMLGLASKMQKDALSGQVDLFGNSVDASSAIRIQLVEPDTQPHTREQLLWERELLGIYLSQHPLEHYKLLLEEQTVPLQSLTPEMDGKNINCGGVITESREITTKNGQKMAFVKIADEHGESELILFPSMYQQTIGIWERDKVIIARGKISAKDRDGAVSNEIKILVDDAREVSYEQASAYESTGKTKKVPKATSKPAVKAKATVAENTVATSSLQRLYIRIESPDDHTKLIDIKQIIDTSRGETDVVLVVGPGDAKQAIKLPVRIEPTEEHIAQIAELIGSDNIKLQ